MRPSAPGRRKPGSEAFTPSEVINLILAVCAAPPPGRPRPNVVEAVRALRAAERAWDWEQDGPEHKPKPKELLQGLSRAPEAATFGDLIDSVFADMMADTWKKWVGVFGYARLRFINGGERILISFDRWPTTSPVDRQECSMIFRSEWLQKLYPDTALEGDIRVSEFLLLDLADFMRPPP